MLQFMHALSISMLLSRGIVRPVAPQSRPTASPIMSSRDMESSLSVNEMKRLLSERGVDFRGACRDSIHDCWLRVGAALPRQDGMHDCRFSAVVAPLRRFG